MIVRYITQHHRIRANGNIVTNDNAAHDHGAYTDIHVIANHGNIMLTLAIAYSNAMPQCAILPNNGIRIQDDTAEVPYSETAAYLCATRQMNPRQQSN